MKEQKTQTNKLKAGEQIAQQSIKIFQSVQFIVALFSEIKKDTSVPKYLFFFFL